VRTGNAQRACELHCFLDYLLASLVAWN